ncbi:hypothetical protein F0562_003606 [Nyssa sinensis]|uniref:Uncharacterized protein n=1 Tax=Nyssa sinensis TaxID=561372 RepID=A0A5J5BVY6_9ASTE|nr:hypothetical protein F0562_003606 [Nyssa sinensis]
MQSKRHVGPATIDAAEDIEVNVVEGDGAIHKCQDQFAASLAAMAKDLHSLILDDDDDDDGDFTLNTSIAGVLE